MKKFPSDSNDAQLLAGSLQTLTANIEAAAQNTTREMVVNTQGAISNAQLTQGLNALVASIINASSVGVQNVMNQFPAGSSGASAVTYGLQVVIPAIINAASVTAHGIINNTPDALNPLPTHMVAITGTITANPDGGLSITGTAQAGSTLKITYPDGSVDIATANLQGHYSATTHTPQTSGSVHLAAVDASGQATGISTDIAYTDVTPPLAPTITSVTPHTDGGITVAGIAEAGSTVTVTYPDGSTDSTTANRQGQYSLTTHAMQLGGTVDVCATDLAGNASAHSDVAYVATPLVSFTAIAPDINADGDFVASANHLVFQGQLSIPLASGEQVQIGGSGGWLTAEVNGTTWSYDDSTGAAIPDGTYTIQARMVDSAGNVLGVPVSQVFIIDTTTSLIPSVSSVITNTDGGLTITGTAKAGSTIQVTYPDGATAQVTADSNGHYNVTNHTPQMSGTIDITATDLTGNTSPSINIAYPTPPQTIASVPIQTRANDATIVSQPAYNINTSASSAADMLQLASFNRLI